MHQAAQSELKKLGHRRKPLKQAGITRRCMKFPVIALPESLQKKIALYPEDISSAGQTRSLELAASAHQKKGSKARFGFAHTGFS
jgi:hypothetical protein